MSYLDTKYPEEIGLGITACCVWSRNESDRENSIWNIDIIVMQKKSDIIVNKLILRATFLKVAHLYLLFFWPEQATLTWMKHGITTQTNETE